LKALLVLICAFIKKLGVQIHKDFQGVEDQPVNCSVKGGKKEEKVKVSE